MGIDPGVNTTGWAFIINLYSGRTIFYKGVVKNHVKHSKSIKLRRLNSSLSDLIRIWAPSLIGLEEIFVNKNWSSSLTLAYARGACLSAIGPEPYVDVHNNTLRRIFGKLWYSKNSLARYLSFLFNTNMSADDSTDALAIAYATIQLQLERTHKH